MASACTPCCSSSSTSSLPLHSNITILNLFPSQFQHLNNRFGLSFPPRLQLHNSDKGIRVRNSHNSDKGIRVRNSPRRLRVFCLREPNAAVVTGKSWDNLILKSEVPVLVEFYASWCGPCRMVHRMIDEIATEYSGRLNCFVLHADNDVDIAEEYDIKAVPVVLLFKNGEKHDSVIGTMPKEFYVAAIERVLAS